jgi:hypothetical protein
VQVVPQPPDPAAVSAMYQMTIAQDRHDIASVPVNLATDMLQGENIWTHTPTSPLADEPWNTIRRAARVVSLSLFGLAIVWTGIQIALGTATGMGSAMLLLPQLIAGFMLAWYAELISIRAIELCNAINGMMTDTTLPSFTGEALLLPERPTIDAETPGIIAVPAGFMAGLFSSGLYALVLIVLEVKMIFRQAIIIVATTVMPIAGALWAVGLTHGWGTLLFRMFFGWLFAQPLVVACLALSASMLGLFQTDGPGVIFVKTSILLVAISMAGIFAVGVTGGGSAFNLGALMLIMRRTTGMVSSRLGRFGGGSSPAPPTPSAPVQPGMARGTGGGTAASSRAWRPAFGTN